MRHLIAFLLLILSIPSYAVPLEGLYSASTVVVDQSQPVRNAAMKEVLKTVVQKVSGRRQELDNPSLQTVLSNVSSYVEQFQYKTLEEEEASYRLTIRFQKAALDNVLQQFSVPIWGKNRPEILLWLAVDDGSGRRMLADESMTKAVLAAASDVGLAMTLPLLDLNDRRALSAKDVWAGFSDQVLNASKRYSVKHIIYGRLRKVSANEWRLTAQLMNGRKRYSMLVQKGNMRHVLMALFSETAESLADIYAPRGTVHQHQVKIHISEVSDLDKMVEVTDYLASLDRVKAVAWKALQGTKLELLLTISGEVTVLKEIISLNKILLLTEPPLLYSEQVLQVGKDFTLKQSIEPIGLPSPKIDTLYYRAN